MSLKPKIIIISGATATGKTSTSIELANDLKQLGHPAEIVNFDSLLFYRELNIGTAKPSIEERQGIKHHLVGNISITQNYNSSHFRNDARVLLNDLISKKITPILVGGSAFYIRALLKGMYKSVEISENTKSKILEIIDQSEAPGEALMNYLKLNDPASSKKLHLNDIYRLTRAVEYHLETNTPFSSQANLAEKNNPYDLTSNLDLEVEPLHFNLDIPKEDQWPLIQKRTNSMIEQGLIREVEDLLSQGFSKDLKPLKSVGYIETINFIDKEIKSIEDLRERISISTRQLAKSQRTFFKKIIGSIKCNPLEQKELVLNQTKTFLNK